MSQIYQSARVAVIASLIYIYFSWGPRLLLLATGLMLAPYIPYILGMANLKDDDDLSEFVITFMTEAILGAGILYTLTSKHGILEGITRFIVAFSLTAFLIAAEDTFFKDNLKYR